MKAAIREGDFKLYKNYQTRDYSLHRLYENGQRDDLEEMKDLAADPEYAPVLKRLSNNLERQLAENQVEGPHLNPAFKGKTKPSAEIESVAFNAASRQATVTLKKSGSAIETAYVIYRNPPGDDIKKARRSTEAFDVRLGIKIAASGNTVNARIPKRIDAYCFLLIDENNYQTFSDICRRSCPSW